MSMSALVGSVLPRQRQAAVLVLHLWQLPAALELLDLRAEQLNGCLQLL